MCQKLLVLQPIVCHSQLVEHDLLLTVIGFKCQVICKNVCHSDSKDDKTNSPLPPPPLSPPQPHW